MKRVRAGIKLTDFLVVMVVVVVLLPFFLFPTVYEGYRSLNASHGYLMSFIKFAILATFGESIGLRIRTGMYMQPRFGILPRALVWGILGISLKMAFVIFADGAPILLKSMGVHFPMADPSEMLREPGFSWLKLLTAFTASVTLNLFFGPIFMIVHRIADMHILATGGTIRGLLTPIRIRYQFQTLDWTSMWGFVISRTIPFWWIPAQTFNFMLPEEWRILVAALYSIILGVILSIAGLMAESRK